MKLKNAVVGSVLALFGFFLVQPISANPGDGRVRDRLNKILYWQISDELKLSPKQEKDLAILIEALQEKREAALKERDTAVEALRTLGKTPEKVAAITALDRYQKSLTALSKLDGEENEKLKAILGPELLVRYYVIRDEVTRKVLHALQEATSRSESKD